MGILQPSHFESKTLGWLLCVARDPRRTVLHFVHGGSPQGWSTTLKALHSSHLQLAVSCSFLWPSLQSSPHPSSQSSTPPGNLKGCQTLPKTTRLHCKNMRLAITSWPVNFVTSLVKGQKQTLPGSLNDKMQKYCHIWSYMGLIQALFSKAAAISFYFSSFAYAWS